METAKQRLAHAIDRRVRAAQSSSITEPRPSSANRRSPHPIAAGRSELRASDRDVRVRAAELGHQARDAVRQDPVVAGVGRLDQDDGAIQRIGTVTFQVDDCGP